jgi:LacI family transcriptional regulator, repressor for deo operon, udp, cdd, tsx, nupC, and nupG
MPGTLDKLRRTERRRGAARIKEVARLAAVSTATVSRALTSPHRVSPGTRARVMAAVAKVGYVPNPAARSLRSQKSHMVLVVLPDLSNIFFSQVLRGIEEELFAAGYGMIVGDLDGSVEKEQHLAAFAAGGQVDGVLLLNGQLFRQSGDPGAAPAEFSVPIVAVCEAIEGANVPQIEVHNRAGACRMTEYLAEIGHSAIGYVCGPATNVLEKERFAGFRDGLANAGKEFDATFVWPGDYKLESGVAVARQIIASERRPTAVFCSSDEMAIGLIRGLASAGLHVPGDISVAGFDDIEFAEMAGPPLTTIRQPRRELGRNGAAALLELLHGRTPSPRIRLDTELIVRASTARPSTIRG